MTMIIAFVLFVDVEWESHISWNVGRVSISIIEFVKNVAKIESSSGLCRLCRKFFERLQ